MDLITSFVKLHETELKLERLAENEEGRKRKKSLALKVKNVKYIESNHEVCKSETDEDMNLIFQIFKEFLRYENCNTL